MPATAHDVYVETQVRTATPQRLRLMLIEGALRFARRTLELWDDPRQREAQFTALVRCRNIVSELYATIKADDFPPAERVKAIYLFLFHQLADASFSHDAQKVHDVVRVLEQERITWQELCAKTPEAPPRQHAGPQGCCEITAAPLPHAPAADRLVLEA